jgi:hypothetical protein
LNYEQQQREKNALRKPLCPDCKCSLKQQKHTYIEEGLERELRMI